MTAASCPVNSLICCWKPLVSPNVQTVSQTEGNRQSRERLKWLTFDAKSWIWLGHGYDTAMSQSVYQDNPRSCSKIGSLHHVTPSIDRLWTEINGQNPVATGPPHWAPGSMSHSSCGTWPARPALGALGALGAHPRQIFLPQDDPSQMGNPGQGVSCLLKKQHEHDLAKISPKSAKKC